MPRNGIYDCGVGRRVLRMIKKNKKKACAEVEFRVTTSNLIIGIIIDELNLRGSYYLPNT